MPIIPILLTLGTLGTLYYTRDPVRELKTGRSYRMALTFVPSAFNLPPDVNTASTVLTQLLTQVGFTNVRRVKDPTPQPDGSTVWWFDGTWSRPESIVTTPFPAGVSAPAVYAKLF